MSADYEFMRDTLGITDENECSVLQTKIKEVSTDCVEECCVYGWGNNKHGQLAQGKTMIQGQPMKLSLPGHIVLDETKRTINSIKDQYTISVTKIFCSSRFSGLLLSNGEFWAAGNCAGAGKNIVANPGGSAAGTSGAAADSEMMRDEEFKRIVQA